MRERPDELPEILTPEQVAEYLQISHDKVQVGLESGEIPATKILGEWRVLKHQLQEFLGLHRKEHNLKAERVRGIVKFYHQEHGYGFIKSEDGRDIYVKAIDVEDWEQSLRIGTKVEFEIGSDGKGGSAAKKVIVISSTRNTRKAASGWSKSGRQKSAKGMHFFNEALRAKERRELERAREFFEKAISFQDNFDAFLAYAAMEGNAKNVEKAIKILERGIKLFPDIGLFYERYGTILLKSNMDLKRAMEILKEGLQKTIPRFAKSLHWTLARVLLGIGDDSSLQEAFEHAEKAKKLGMPLTKDSEYQKLNSLVKPLVRKTLNLFKAADFDFSKKVQSTADYIDLFVRPKSPEYTEAYALDGWMLVRCSFKRVVKHDIDQMVDTLRFPPYKDFSIGDVGFLVLNDLTSCYHILEHVKEEKGEVIIPINEELLNLSKPDISISLRSVLDQWLARRDLFDFRFPVKGRRFFGRSKELLNLIGYIDDGHYVGVYGLRKVGKTSLLYQIKEKRANDLVVYIDLQDSVPIKDCNYLYWKIANELQSVLQQKKQELEPSQEDIILKLGSIQKYTELQHPEEKNLLYFDEDINYLFKRLAEHEKTKGTKIIIVLDELESMLPIRTNSAFKGYVDFFKYLRGISQRTQGKLVNVVAAANPSISEQARWEGIDNPMFHFYEEMFLPLLEKNDCSKMLEELGKSMSVLFDEESLNCIYSETGGHPSIARQLCSYITKDKHRPFQVTKNIVLENLESFIIVNTTFFNEILERLDIDFPIERDILLEIAKGVSKEYELSNIIDEPIDVGLRHLIGYQIVEHQNDEYKIKINLLYRWIRRFRLGMKG